MDVLFHITDDEAYGRAIANLAAMLRPGGLLVLTENSVHGQALRSERQASRTLATIEGLVRANGLEPRLAAAGVLPDERPGRLGQPRAALDLGLTTRLLTRRPALGNVLGPLLYPFELGLASVAREGPSTEMMVCRFAQPGTR